MRLPHQDTIAAFAQPSVSNGVVVFLCGFLTVCLMSPVVYALLWLVRLLAAVMKTVLLTPPHPLEGCSSISLTPEFISLSEDGRVHLGFHFLTKPEAFWNSAVEEPIPVAVFSPRLELKRAEWITPRR